MEIVVVVAILLLLAVTVGKLSSRLLGVRLGKVRGVVAGILGWIVGLFAAGAALGESDPDGGYILHAEDTGDLLVLMAVIIFFGVLAAMPIAIALDLLTRKEKPAGRRRRRWLRPVKTLKAALTPYGRLREVAANARRAGLFRFRFASRAALESPDLSRRLRIVLENSGGMLVKFGQIASTRTDILPATLTDELSSLRGDVRPVGPEGIRQVLEAELGEPVESAFRSFEWEPLAAASIGQTHRAVLTDGTPVVVKVQRPGIADIVARDAAVLRLASRQVERRVAAARSLGLRGLCEELIVGIQAELDYLSEAAVGTRLREQRAKDVGIAVPKVYPALSTDRVLVMEEVRGAPISPARLAEGGPVTGPDLARRLLASFLGQILDDGLFHADPHPGNLLMDADGTIWMLDFGSVGQLDTMALGGLRSVAIGIATNDAGVLARATRELAGNDATVDLRSLESDLAVTLAQLDAGGGVDPRMFVQVLSVMHHHGMSAPKSITLLARALLTLEGTLKMLAPGFSIATESTALIKEGRSVFGSPKEILQKEALRSLPALRTLPEHVEALAGLARAGRLTVRTEHFSGPDGARVNSWVDQLALVVVGGFGAVAAALLLVTAAAATDHRLQVVLYILGFGGLVGASVLLLRSAARALRRDSARLE